MSNLVYNLFVDGTEGMWRALCPCPYASGGRCPYGKHCVFWHEVSAESFKSGETSEIVSFCLLKSLFYLGSASLKEKEPPSPPKPKLRPTALRLGPSSSSSPPQEQQMDVKRMETLPPIYLYMRELGIQFKTALCRNAAHPSNCAEMDNGLAHHPQELIEQFASQKMRDYYQRYFKRPVPYQVRPINRQLRCESCCSSNINEINPGVVAYDEQSGRLIEPVIHILCIQCLSTTIIDIYV